MNQNNWDDGLHLNDAGVIAEINYCALKESRHLDANGFSDREWLWLKIGAAAVTALALFGCGYLVGWLG